MRLNSIRLQNFRQHRDTFMELGDGLTGIIGPNGAGKSTILEAIAWALYGNPAARGTRDSIRHARSPAGSPVKVELNFDLAGHRYHVIRGLSSAQVYLDGAEAPVAHTITGVTELLQRRLGMSRPEFFNTYFTGQKELNVMAAMGPSERAQFLSRVLGYERLRTAQKLAREKRAALAAEATGLRGALPDPETVARTLSEAEERFARATARREQSERMAAAATARLVEVTPRWESAQKEREKLQQLHAEQKVAEGDEAARQRDAERLARELEEARTAGAELATLRQSLVGFDELTRELSRLDELARDEGRRVTLVESLRVLDEDIARLKERAAQVENAHVLEEEAALELKERTKELDHLHGLLEERRTAWVRDRQDAETKRDELRRQYGELKIQREQLVELGEEGICPTCTRPLGQNFRTVLEDVEAKLGMVAVDGRYYANRLDQLEKMPDDLRELEDKRRALVQSQSALERRLAKCQAAVQEKAQVAAEIDARETRRVKLSADLQSIASGYDASRHRELRSEVERLSGLRARVEVLGSRVEREPQLRDEHARVMGLLEQLKERLSELRRAVSEIATDEAAFTKLRQEFEQLSDSARVAELAAVASAGEEETTRQAAETARRVAVEQEKMRQKLAELQGRRLLHDEVDRAYTDLRTELNFQLRPELSETASGFLSELTDGRYGEMELDDQYNIIVLEDGTPKPVISGGEEDLANLVLRLAISQMIADRAGQRFSLLILDEVFGSLDEIRRGTVMELLRRLQDRFEQVVLITHIETVRDGLDRVISVRYDAASGSSHVENGGLMATPEILDDSKLRGTGEAAD